MWGSFIYTVVFVICGSVWNEEGARKLQLALVAAGLGWIVTMMFSRMASIYDNSSDNLKQWRIGAERSVHGSPGFSSQLHRQGSSSDPTYTLTRSLFGRVWGSLQKIHRHSLSVGVQISRAFHRSIKFCKKRTRLMVVSLRK